MDNIHKKTSTRDSYVESEHEYFSCQFIEDFHLFLNRHVNTYPKFVRFCDEPLADLPGFSLNGTAEDIIKNITLRRLEIIAESKSDLDNERIFTATCAKCTNYRKSNWVSDNLIHRIDLGMYPSPCQSKCIYCGVHDSEMSVFNKDIHSENYEKVFQIIDILLQKNMIAEDSRWIVAPGEITIHPLKDRILDLVDNRTAVFLTNCIIYNDKIAENLKTNPSSKIILSIDCGTAETSRKVKGVNDFDKVLDNIKRYSANCSLPEQIELKYIILPEINDNMTDYVGIVEIMKTLNLTHLIISQDLKLKYSTDEKYRNSLIKAGGGIAAVLLKNKFTMSLASAYMPNDIAAITDLAEELLRMGDI